MKGGGDCYNHLHISSGLRTTQIYNSFINRPDKVGQFAGQFESEGDLNLCSEKYSKYHVYNFSSTDNRHGAQLLIPHDENRMFLRFQEGNGYSKPREVAFIDDNAVKKSQVYDIEKRLLKVEKRVYPLKRIWRHVKKWFVKE